jgi:hypothetical protein
MESALRDHVAAIDRLAARGLEIQRTIDEIVHSLRQTTDGAGIDQLFGRSDAGEQRARPQDAAATNLEPPVRRRAKFE